MVIFINQIRMGIGVMLGNSEITSGDNSLKFYAWIRLDIRRNGTIKRSDKVILVTILALRLSSTI